MNPSLAKGGHLDYLFDKLEPKTKEEQERRQKLEDEKKTYLAKFNKTSKTTFRNPQDQRKAQQLKREKKFPQYGGSTLLNGSDGPVLDIKLPKKLPKREGKQKEKLGKIDQKLNVLEGNKEKLEKNIENYNRIYGKGDLPKENVNANASAKTNANANANAKANKSWYSNVFKTKTKKNYNPQVPKPIYIDNTEKKELGNSNLPNKGSNSLNEITKPETVLNEGPRSDVMEHEDEAEAEAEAEEQQDEDLQFFDPATDGAVHEEEGAEAIAPDITKPLEQPQASTVVPVTDENITVEPIEKHTEESKTLEPETPVEVPAQSTVVPVSDENITVEPIEKDTAEEEQEEEVEKEEPETLETKTPVEAPAQATVVPVKENIVVAPIASTASGTSIKEPEAAKEKVPKPYDDTFYITKEDSKAIKQQYDTKISSLDRQLQQFPAQYTKGLANTDYKTLMAKYSAMDGVQQELNTLLGKQIELDAVLKVGKNKKTLELQRLNQLNLKKHKLDKLHKLQRHLHREKKRALINAKKTKRNEFNEEIRSENARIKAENDKITAKNNETLKSNAEIKKKNAHFQALKKERAEKYPETHGHYASSAATNPLTPATTRATRTTTHTTTQTVHTTGSTTTNSDSIIPSELNAVGGATTSVISETRKPVEKDTKPLTSVSSSISHTEEEPEVEDVVADGDATAETASEATSYIPGEISENEEDLADIEDNEEQIEKEFDDVSQEPLITTDEKKQYHDQKFSLESLRLEINKKLDKFNTLQHEITAILTKPATSTTRTTLQTTPKTVAQPSPTPAVSRQAVAGAAGAAGTEPAYQLKDLKKLNNQINAPSDDELTKLSDLAESSDVDETIAPKESLIAPIAVVDPIALESEPEPSPIPTREPTPEPEVAAAAALVPVEPAGPVVPTEGAEGAEPVAPVATNRSVDPTVPEGGAAAALVPTEDAGPVVPAETSEPVAPVTTNKSTEPALTGAAGAVVPAEPSGPVVPTEQAETSGPTGAAEPTSKTLGGVAVVAPVIPLGNVVPAAPASAAQSAAANGVPLQSVVPQVSPAPAHPDASALPAQNKAVEPAGLSEVKPADDNLPVEKPDQIILPAEDEQTETPEHFETPTAVVPPPVVPVVADEKIAAAKPVEPESEKEPEPAPKKSLQEQLKDVKPEVVEEEVTTIQPITLAPGEEPPAPSYHSKIEEEVKTPTSSTFTQTTIKSPAEFKDLPSTVLADGKQDHYVSSPLNQQPAGTAFTKKNNDSESSLFSEYSEEEIVSAPNTETHSLVA